MTGRIGNISSVVSQRGCSGCGLCSSVCTVKAIHMEWSNMGNLYPHVDENCIECGECLQVCPWKNNLVDIATNDKFEGNIIRTFVGYSRNDQVFYNSQSGGIVTQILYSLFENNSIDAAIVCTSSKGFPYPDNKAFVATAKEELFFSQKSIYTPIDVLSILADTHKYLSLAIVALPCQVEALRVAQKKGLYKNVSYVIGLICDRILSREVMSLLSDKAPTVPYNVLFRDKRYGYKSAPITISCGEKEQQIINPIRRHCLKDFYTHPRCYACFDKLNIFADIVCGDPWNLKGDINWDKGASLVLVRTENGQRIINHLQETHSMHLIDNYNVTEVLNAQGLAYRKKRCAAAIKVYEKKGWEIPDWLHEIIKPININTEIYNEVVMNIENYLRHENSSSIERMKDAKKIIDNKETELRNQDRFYKRLYRKIKKILHL